MQQHNDKILALNPEFEDLIIKRINGREHADVYDSMITKREQLKSTNAVLDDILSQGEISDTNLSYASVEVNRQKKKVPKNRDFFGTPEWN